MQRKLTRLGYSTRIEKVVALMGERLDQPLTLEALAAAGHFSPYHFHRIYRGLMGETVAGTLRRMRLHRASMELLHGTRTLADIARRCGYGSTAAFNRAFALAYVLPPGEFRRRGGLGSAARPAIASNDLAQAGNSESYAVAIETHAPVTVAAWRHRGAYHAIGDTFERLSAWAAGRGLAEGRSFGAYHGDPDSTPADELVSDACMQVPDDVASTLIDSDARGPRHCRIEGGRHAVLLHTGPYAELERPYRWLFSQWLPASGEEAAHAPMIEEYLNDPRTLPPSQWRTAIRLPLQGDSP